MIREPLTLCFLASIRNAFGVRLPRLSLYESARHVETIGSLSCDDDERGRVESLDPNWCWSVALRPSASFKIAPARPLLNCKPWFAHTATLYLETDRETARFLAWHHLGFSGLHLCIGRYFEQSHGNLARWPTTGVYQS